jgi:imidazolonepropionase-like amidohydrolase
MPKIIASVILVLFLVSPSLPQQNVSLSAETRQFVSIDAPLIALTHARVIDGTGAPARADQTIIISNGKIQAVGPGSTTPAPEGAKVMDLTGKTVMPGLVMLHEHIFFPAGRLVLFSELGWSFPRLYLAAGVTSIRTAGSVEPYTDLNIKKLIDAGRIPGPKMDVTGPYLDGKGSFATQFHVLTDAADARRMVSYWADQGVTSFKGYMYITREELGAAIDEAHRRKIKVTGHLCAVGFREAAALGIDNLEHGIIVDTEFVPGKKPDVCPPQSETVTNLTKLDIESAPVKEMIRDLVARKVAVTSTLPVFESFVANRPPLQKRAYWIR